MGEAAVGPDAAAGAAAQLGTEHKHGIHGSVLPGFGKENDLFENLSCAAFWVRG